MANGRPCVHCGWKESEHISNSFGWRSCIPGREKKLADCPVYEPEIPDPMMMEISLRLAGFDPNKNDRWVFMLGIIDLPDEESSRGTRICVSCLFLFGRI